MKRYHSATMAITTLMVLAGTVGQSSALAQELKSTSEVSTTDLLPSFTQGEATSNITQLYKWTGNNPRTANFATIRSTDGTQWTVPAKTNFQTVKAADLYNEANGFKPEGIADVNLETVPIIEAGGEEVFTAYVFGDNYFEFHVNGKLLAVDAVPMTPFNSSVIRFKTSRPFTIGIMGVDWEERLGLGFEKFRGATFHQGDAGLVAVIKDASGETVAISDESWKAQTFYTAPLKSKSDLVLRDGVRDSSAASTEDVADGTLYYAAHWPVPRNWSASDFNDGGWPKAATFTNEFVGVDNKPAYTNFTGIFDDPAADAQFIWSSSLVHDNVVLLRKTVGK